MTHFSENSKPLTVKKVFPKTQDELRTSAKGITDVCLIRLPAANTESDYNSPLRNIGEIISDVANNLGEKATLIVLAEVIDLVLIQSNAPSFLQYQHWIAIKRSDILYSTNNKFLPNQHFGALIFTKYKGALKHTKTRIEYTYCPICDKTTKDYGGKKHTYHEAGTLLSDIWRDASYDFKDDLSSLINRFADLLGIEAYKELNFLDYSKAAIQRTAPSLKYFEIAQNNKPLEVNKITQGDCLELLEKLPDNSVDFAFADPPYNLKKKYLGYSDDLNIQDYFKWCDDWIRELARVLKPGRTLALLNIPLWAIRHFLFAQTLLEFQNWIVWDALAFPVRLIMPAHYSILCFTKGRPREVPGLNGDSTFIKISTALKTFHALKPLAEGYCLREKCVDNRIAKHIDDRDILTDVWGDIHRLKHNSRRVDHPCQLPPHLMYRLITIFSKPDEIILDCFNGAGTTTLAADQLGRKYIGVDFSEKYCLIAKERHIEIKNGIDPFRKADRVLTSKNSRVKRLPKQIYRVPKKTLQLEVRRIAKEIGHIPSRDEVIKFGKYSIEYYDLYFVSWGEVTAAARNNGMTEDRVNNDREQSTRQLQLLERRIKEKGLKSAKSK